MKFASFVLGLLVLYNVAESVSAFACACAPGPPVCASNGETYLGECNLRCAAHSWNVPLRKEYDGPCHRKAPGYACACPPENDICGSDGRTYSGECNLQCGSELLGVRLHKLHDGKC